MSRPGFPIDMSQTITVHSTYHSASSNTDFPGSDPLLSREVHEDKVGDNTPGWPSHKQTNAYVRYKASWSQSPLSVDGTVNADTFYGQWGNTFGLGYNPTIDGSRFSQTDAINRVRDRLYNKLISNIQSNRVELGELYHTRKQTAEMVTSTMKKIAGAFTAVRHGNPRRAIEILGGSGKRGSRRRGRVTRTVGGVPGEWLALQYGWLPLISDAHSALEGVERCWNNPNSELIVSHASATEVMDDVIYQSQSGGAHGPVMEWRASGRKVSGKASIAYGVLSNSAQALSQFGITNPLSLTWELLPYSFVVDWFYPIGPYLASLDYQRGLEFKHGWLSYRAEQRYKSRIAVSRGVNGSIIANWSGGEGSGEGMYFHREGLSAFPDPPKPGLKDPLSLAHVANAFSLLSQAFSGGVKPHQR